MNNDSIEKFEDKLKYIGFEKLLSDQFQAQLAAGATDFSFRHQDAYAVRGSKGELTDRIVFDIKAASGDTNYLLNSMDATIVKNMPVIWEHEGVNLTTIEHQLNNISLEVINGKGHVFGDDLKADLHTLYGGDPVLFYKLAALYMPAIEPILLAEDKDKVMSLLADGFDGQIRNFEFAPYQKITRLEAFNLLDSIDQPRAVHKTYFIKGDKDNDEWEQGPAKSESFSRWRTLGYDKETNTHTLIDYGENYKVDLVARLADHAVHQPTGKDLSDFLYNMQKGHIQGLMPLDTARHEVVFFHLNIRKGNYGLSDENGQPVDSALYLTPAARKAEATRQQARSAMTVPTRPIKPGAAAEGPEGEKKNSPPHQRIMSGDSSRNPGQHP